MCEVWVSKTAADYREAPPTCSQPHSSLAADPQSNQLKIQLSVRACVSEQVAWAREPVSVRVCKYRFPFKGTWEWAAWAVLAQLPPKPAPLSTQIWEGLFNGIYSIFLGKKKPERHLSAQTCLCSLCARPDSVPHLCREPGSRNCGTCWGGDCLLPSPTHCWNCEQDRVWLKRMWTHWETGSCGVRKRWPG